MSLHGKSISSTDENLFYRKNIIINLGFKFVFVFKFWHALFTG